MKKERYIIVLFFLIQNIIHNLGHAVTPTFVRSLNIPDYMFGIFFATMSFGLLIGGPIWGTLGDRGKKKVYIVIGLLLYSVGQFFFGYSNNQYLMIFFRFVSGFGVVASITLLTSNLIEITEKKDRAKFLSMVAAAITLGASIGYYTGGFIAENEFTRQLFHMTNNKEVFLIQALLNLLYIGLIVLLFYDKKGVTVPNEKITIIQSFKLIKKTDYKLLLFLLALTFITMGNINMNKFIDVYFNDLNFTSLDLGKFKLVAGAVTLFTSLILAPLFAKLKKQVALILVIQILSAFIIFYTFRANSFIRAAYSIYMTYILLKALFTPLEQNYISLHAKEGEYGRIMGIRQLFLSAGMVIGPLVGGFLYQKSSLLLFDSSAITFLIGFILLLFISIPIHKKQQTNESL